MSQPKRTETLERFKKSEIRLLVCSDVAARGLDIQGLSHVFNFDVPYHAEDYVHRIGRTGRAGREGRSFTLAAPEDGKSVAAIQKLIARDIPFGAVPGIPNEELDFEDRPRNRRGKRPERKSAAPERRESKPEAPKRTDSKRAAPKPVRFDDNIAPFPKRDRQAPVRERDFDDAPVAPGFGDHMPAFLARAPRLAGQG
jgi:superfamily II DNA/RNA helicase